MTSEHEFDNNGDMNRTYVCKGPVSAGRSGAAARTALRIGLASVLAASLVVLLFVPTADADRGAAPTVSYVVRSGDTLWELAAAHTPPAGDVRRTIASIQDANGLDSALITAGEEIEIPVGENPGRRPRAGGA